ncbi:MAG: hypothetical protein MUF16_29705 [Burkholderiaceae bacterium]|jgi:hypothetical protein|nr:hypothetical protein [Burkholderiaceae bacterium]
MKYTLKIGSHIDVPIAFSLRDGAKDLPFTFTLSVRRLDAEELKALGERLAEGQYEDRDFLADHVVGWRGQQLVMDDAQPAAYGPEAMDVMCSVVGLRALMAKKVFDALVSGATTASADKAKN